MDGKLKNQPTEPLLRAAVERSPVGVVIVDCAGTIVMINAALERLFGYDRDELFGQAVEVLIPMPFREGHPRLRTQFCEHPESRPIGACRDLQAQRKDGSEFSVEVGLSPVETDEGLFVIAAVVDITQRKAAERELRDLNATLEDRVAERTREVQRRATQLERTAAALRQQIVERKRTEKALRVAKDAAEAANRSKSTFLANMSHEIRTPMNAVIGLTGLVLDSELTPKQREYLHLVRESGESLLHLIDDILDFSKIEAGRLSLQSLAFDHEELMGDTMKSLALKAHAKGVELLHATADDVPHKLMGDPRRLQQVIVNLVGNAIKFTDEGEVMLDVRLEGRRGRRVELRYAVSDTGIGIPAKQQERIFEAFEQVETTTTTRRYGGTGLGLAVSRRMVELMGGRIWVESRPQRGATFYFTAKFESGRPHDGDEEESLTLETLHDMPVLVVDDNATNRRILCRMLRNWRMQPSDVPGGGEALAALNKAQREGRPFRLVLTDAHMPEIDGFTLAERIAADAELSGTVIMMLSSGDQATATADGSKAKIAACLLKPIKQSELLDAIMLVLGVSPDRRPVAAAPTALKLRPLRILLAEDSEVNQRLACALLERQGHHVEVAGDGREALEKLKMTRFDLVLMDVRMPEMDGLDATRIIRARERLTGRHVPIVALTAHAMRGDRERCLAAGADEYVPKPIRPDDLFSAMARALPQSVGDGGGARAGSAKPKQAPAVKQPKSPKPVEHSASEPAVRLARLLAEPGGTVDWSAALERTHNDPEVLADLATLFLKEQSRYLTELEEAIGGHDAKSAHRAAHTLKGQFRIFGANRAADYALQIEIHARDNDMNVGSLLESLREEGQKVHDAVIEFVGAKA